MFPAQTRPLLAAVLCLAALTSLSALAGGSDGGGTEINGHVLDTQVRDNTIIFRKDEEITHRISNLENALNVSLPDVGTRFYDFIEDPATRKRFILADKLPNPQAPDVMHSVGDRLVGLQRGPNVWVLKDFYSTANADDRFNFAVHEFLVSEKLRNGRLTEQDKEEVLNVSAYLSKYINKLPADGGPATPDLPGLQAYYANVRLDASSLQKLFGANHFEPGMTAAEHQELSAASDKLNQAIDKACPKSGINYTAAKQVTLILNWFRAQGTDENSSEAKRTLYKHFMSEIDQKLGGKQDIKTICKANEEVNLEDAFGDSLKPASRPSPSTSAGDATPESTAAPTDSGTAQ